MVQAWAVRPAPAASLGGATMPNGGLGFVRVAIGIVAALGLGGLIVNTILTGRDIPAGVLTILVSIIGAIFGIEAVQRTGGRDATTSDLDADAGRRGRGPGEGQDGDGK